MPTFPSQLVAEVLVELKAWIMVEYGTCGPRHRSTKSPLRYTVVQPPSGILVEMYSLAAMGTATINGYGRLAGQDKKISGKNAGAIDSRRDKKDKERTSGEGGQPDRNSATTIEDKRRR